MVAAMHSSCIVFNPVNAGQAKWLLPHTPLNLERAFMRSNSTLQCRRLPLRAFSDTLVPIYHQCPAHRGTSIGVKTRQLMQCHDKRRISGSRHKQRASSRYRGFRQRASSRGERHRHCQAGGVQQSGAARMRRQRQERANQIAGFAFVQVFGDARNRSWARPGALPTIHCMRIYVMNECGRVRVYTYAHTHPPTPVPIQIGTSGAAGMA